MSHPLDTLTSTCENDRTSQQARTSPAWRVGRIASDPLFARMSHADMIQCCEYPMGTAHLLQDAEQRNGTYYCRAESVPARRRGRGKSPRAVYPTVEGASDPSRRPEAGRPRRRNAGLELHGEVDHPARDDHLHARSAAKLSEITENGYFTQHSKNWANQGILPGLRRTRYARPPDRAPP